MMAADRRARAQSKNEVAKRAQFNYENTSLLVNAFRVRTTHAATEPSASRSLRTCR